ncbi:hypothetical protein CUR178_00592 [Leishmania enriettii]|uniref:L-seryl-tRNA(Sec) kinase n=1 Tax=Leishmania enriettii TaxID=5663 RepID=A0A836KB92_LEIEN|nr:hypothetical protein CUR178_00592 [Leishmania enriettii]
MTTAPLSPLSRHPSALLFLVTGLPAAGKSTFLAAAQRHVLESDSTAGKVPLFGGRCHGRISSVLQVDKVLADLEKSTANNNDLPSSAGERKFSPLLWRRATRRLLELAQSALLTSVAGAADGDATQDAVIPMVFVEDNMHYRSMRERYYQMCRTLERGEHSEEAPRDTPAATAQSQHPYIVLFELRFVTPLVVCLARNAQRVSPRKVSGNEEGRESAWVPPQVICSMDALFDHCYAAADRMERTAGALSDSRVWQWTATTQPWGLLVHGTRSVLGDNPPAAPRETAAAFFDVALQQSEAWEVCQRQCQDTARSHLQRLREEEHLNAIISLRRAAEAVESQVHQLDLQLRRVVHAFLRQRYDRPAHGTEDAPSSLQRAALFHKSIAAAKQEAAHNFKVQLRQLSTAKKEVASTTDAGLLIGSIDDMQESVLQQFQHRVLELWREFEECALPVSLTASTTK